jgi:hypothetical protein
MHFGYFLASLKTRGAMNYLPKVCSGHWGKANRVLLLVNGLLSKLSFMIGHLSRYHVEVGITVFELGQGF